MARRKLTPEDERRQLREAAFLRLNRQEAREQCHGWTHRPWGFSAFDGRNLVQWSAWAEETWRPIEAASVELGMRVAHALHQPAVPQWQSALCHAAWVTDRRRRAAAAPMTPSSYRERAGELSLPASDGAAPASAKERFERGEAVTAAEAKALHLVQGALF